MVLAPVWQHPFVSVFKICEVENWKHVTKQGDVVAVLDKLIGKRVFKIAGTVPAANFVQLPKQRSQNLGLTGRFLYLEVCAVPSKYFVIHLESLDVDDNVQRVSLSNIYKDAPQDRRLGTGKGQVPLHTLSQKWAVVAVDMHAVLRQEAGATYKCVKAIQFCANLRVRGAYTSDIKYSLCSLPREMVMSAAVDPSYFDFVWLPSEPDDSDAVPRAAMPRVQHGAVRSPLWVGTPHAEVDVPGVGPPADAAPRDYSRSYPDRASSPPAAPPPSAPSRLDSGPLLQLARVNGFTGEYTNAATWAPRSQELLFIAANNVVAMHSATGAQRFFFGHTHNVVSIAFSGDGALMATAQEGRQAVIRLWDFATAQCLAIVCGHASGMVCVDLSPDGRALLGVGLDATSRQQITLWNVEGVAQGKRAQLVLKTTTEYNVKRAKFSEYEADKLMTVGRDSIRMYRIKGGVLRGLSVPVTDANRKMTAMPGGAAVTVGHDIFTDIAFERGASMQSLTERHVYVSSASGAVYQVNYGNHSLDAVYQLHNGAINSIVVNEGFAVTGSDDKFLRVWPVDFSDFFLEAEHEAAVTAVGMSPDGLQVCIGTENGSLGTLDVASHKYTTVLRSHSDSVNCIALDGVGQHCVTASSDGTIRVWELATYQQLYEFDAPGEIVQCVACHPQQPDIACGFHNGKLRVFHVPTTSLIQEHSQHRVGICEMAYSSNGERLFTISGDGTLCVHDVLQLYLPLHFLRTATTPLSRVCMALSPDGRRLCTTSRDAQSSHASLLFFSGVDLKPELRIDTESPGFVRLAFAPDANELWAATTDDKLERYSATEGVLMQVIPAGHRDEVHALAMHPSGHFLFSGAFDKLLKVWDVGACPSQLKSRPAAALQSFIGHSDAVTSILVAGDVLVTADAGDCLLFWNIRDLPQLEPPPRLLHPPPSREIDDGASQSLEPETVSGPFAAHAHPEAHSRPFSVPQLHPRYESFDTQSATAEPIQPEQPPLLALNSHLPPRAPGGGGGPPRLTPAGVVGLAAATHNATLWLPSAGLLVYAADNVLVVDDLRARRQRFLTCNEQEVTVIASAGPNSNVIASASRKLRGRASATADICLWDLERGICTRTLSYHPAAVQALAFSEDARWLVSVGRDPERSVVVWDVSSGEAVAVGRTERATEAVCWRRGTELPEFVTAGSDGLLLWTLEPTHLAQRPLSLPQEASESGCTAVYCTVTGGEYVGDACGRVWSLGVSSAGACQYGLAASGLGGAVQSIEVAGSHMAVATSSGHVVALRCRGSGPHCFWDETARMELDAPVLSATFSDDLTEGVVSTAAATLWHIDLMQLSRTPLVSAHSQPVLSLAAAPGDPSLVASTSEDGLLRIWQMSGADAVPLTEFESSSSCCCAAFDDSGASIVAGYADGALRWFDLQTVSVRWSVARHSSPVVAVVISAAGDTVLTASRDGALAVSDAESAQLSVHSKALLDVLEGAALDCVAASPVDAALMVAAWGRGLAVCSVPWRESALRVIARYDAPEFAGAYDQEAGALARFVSGMPSNVVYTCPRLAGRIIQFDYRTCTVTRTFDLPQPLCSLAQRDHQLAAGGSGASVFMVNLNSGSWTELKGHVHAVQAIAFTGDGARVASAGARTVLLWDN